MHVMALSRVLKRLWRPWYLERNFCQSRKSIFMEGERIWSFLDSPVHLHEMELCFFFARSQKDYIVKLPKTQVLLTFMTLVLKFCWWRIVKMSLIFKISFWNSDIAHKNWHPCVLYECARVHVAGCVGHSSREEMYIVFMLKWSRMIHHRLHLVHEPFATPESCEDGDFVPAYSNYFGQ